MLQENFNVVTTYKDIMYAILPNELIEQEAFYLRCLRLFRFEPALYREQFAGFPKVRFLQI